MSEPTFRIDVEHTPGDTFAEWRANVVRLADDYPCVVRLGDSEEEAVTAAQRWIAEQHRQKAPYSLYVSEAGEILPDGFSVRA